MGAGAVGFGLLYVFDDVESLATGAQYGVGDVVALTAMLALVLAGTCLVAQLPESLTARFTTPPSSGRKRPVYGFGTILAVGVGATLGSPLFILIPLNVVQYEFVSILSLLLATVLSVAMAKLNADLYSDLRARGTEMLGGPSFVRAAVGERSVRYFISRVSMWVANTALAAYTKIVFLIFDFAYMPGILGAYGFGAGESTLAIYLIAGVFVLWTLVNIVFEQRYLKALGGIQIVLTSALMVLLVYHSAVLGGSGGWDLSGIFSVPGGSNWLFALAVNTGFLYLLFFGFQEVQVLERDSVERSKVPVLSWVRPGYTLGKTAFFGAAMVLSVVIAAAVNILYGLSIYSAHPGPGLLQASQIPALYLAEGLGPTQLLVVGAAFLIAAVTTFVPAFLAAARHLSALGEDGYMPWSLARLSWVFTLVAILLLAVGDQNFLVDVTDFMVLVSLGIIALSGVWLKVRRGATQRWRGALSVTVGGACFLFGGAVYFLDPSVVVFGSVAVVVAYLVFDIVELGSIGTRVFLSVFGFICAVALGSFEHEELAGKSLTWVAGLVGAVPGEILGLGLVLCSGLLAGSVVLDMSIFNAAKRKASR